MHLDGERIERNSGGLSHGESKKTLKGDEQNHCDIPSEQGEERETLRKKGKPPMTGERNPNKRTREDGFREAWVGGGDWDLYRRFRDRCERS